MRGPLQTIFRTSVVVLLIHVFVSSSCSPKHACADNHIHPAFIGFLPSDIDTFILRRYKTGENFQHLVDTTLVIDKFASIYTIINDTTVVYINASDPDHWIRPGFDWQLYIPAKNKTVNIANIRSTQVEDRGRACYNPINSFSIDGLVVIPVLVQTDRFYTSGYRVYVRN